ERTRDVYNPILQINAFNASACLISKNWDSPGPTLGRPFGIFACTSAADISGAAQSRCTSYAAVLGKHCVFRGARPVAEKDITDNPTVMVGEVTDAEILWTKPEDIDVAAHPRIGDRMGFSSDHDRGAYFLAADGSVR